MADALKVTVEGLDELDARLTRMSYTSQRNIEAAMDKGADEFVERAKAVCPVRFGELRDSIEKLPIRVSGRKLVLYVVAGVKRRTSTGRTYDEGRLVEFGTVHSAAEPFFFTTWRVIKKRVLSRIARALKAAARGDASDGG